MHPFVTLRPLIVKSYELTKPLPGLNILGLFMTFFHSICPGFGPTGPEPGSLEFLDLHIGTILNIIRMDLHLLRNAFGPSDVFSLSSQKDLITVIPRPLCPPHFDIIEIVILEQQPEEFIHFTRPELEQNLSSLVSSFEILNRSGSIFTFVDLDFCRADRLPESLRVLDTRNGETVR